MNDAIESKDRKKIITLIILIVTLMISTTGATYAFFALSATNNNVISGTSAKVDKEITVTKILPASNSTNTGVMVPQLSANTSTSKNALKQAIEGGCVDANGNIACQVYKITFQNKSTADFRTKASLTLTSTITNLKWYTLVTANDAASVPASPTYSYPASFTAKYGNAKSVTALGAHLELTVNKYRYWYVAIWIEEQGSDQYSADGNKTFTGVVQIDATDQSGNTISGVTSTFTG